MLSELPMSVQQCPLMRIPTFFNLPLKTRGECKHRIPRIFLSRIDFRENCGIPRVLTLCVQIFVRCIIDNIFKKDICFKQVEIISV